MLYQKWECVEKTSVTLNSASGSLLSKKIL